MSEECVELGFLEKRAPWKLSSKFFPSKVGGCPAWLRLNNLPKRSDLKCKSCEKPLFFLLQVYAPVSEFETAFHRTLFLFMCLDGKCCKRFSNKNFVVFRNQLSRRNDFYSYESPKYVEKYAHEPSASQFQKICCVCGCSGFMNCSKCPKVYCCEEHRTFDHKDCGTNNLETKGKNINPYVLPEFELVTETEDLPTVTPEKSDEEKMKEFQQFMQTSQAPRELQDVPMGDLEEILKKKDKAFNKFQKRIKLEPEQVLRYQRGGVPLWVSSDHVPSVTDIPSCICGAARVFEFQVMPQMLNYLSQDSVQDSVDWGTLAVYTCSKSCDLATESYTEEFLWKQDFSED